ncbi:hypothetical protein NQZ79_g3893 [Umbelopsis isabellina]|nr:hypothetical protein NQZ79_g3893 [Umbelopsis isabellina]
MFDSPSKRCTWLAYCLAYIRASILLVSAVVMTTGLLHYTTAAHMAKNQDNPKELLASLFANAIEDRRLISTLVTAHATSVCSLLVLIGQYRQSDEVLPRYKSVFVQLCQIVVPLELMVSWIFCILFDVHTKLVYEKRNHLYTQSYSGICIATSDENAAIQCSMVTLTYTCKYVVCSLLFAELILVSIRAQQKLKDQGQICLVDDDAQILKLELDTQV